MGDTSSVPSSMVTRAIQGRRARACAITPGPDPAYAPQAGQSCGDVDLRRSGVGRLSAAAGGRSGDGGSGRPRSPRSVAVSGSIFPGGGKASFRSAHSSSTTSFDSRTTARSFPRVGSRPADLSGLLGRRDDVGEGLRHLPGGLGRGDGRRLRGHGEHLLQPGPQCRQSCQRSTWPSSPAPCRGLRRSLESAPGHPSDRGATGRPGPAPGGRRGP